MTDGALAHGIRSVATTDTAAGLATLAATLRREHPGDPDAELVARQADLKRRRLVQEN